MSAVMTRPAEAQLERVTTEDVQSLSGKLESFVSELPEQEQLVLGWILSRAGAASDMETATEAARASAGVPVSELMGRAAGLMGDGPEAIQVGPVTVWQFRF